MVPVTVLLLLSCGLLTQATPAIQRGEQQDIDVDRDLREMVSGRGVFVPEVVHAISAEDIWQTAPYCGANSLYALMRLCDVSVDYSQLKKEIPTTFKGASLLELKQAAARYGLAMDVLKIGPSELRGVGFPLIALLGSGTNESVDGHYVVVCRDSADHVMAVDGTTGNLDRLSKSQFNRAFSGYVLAKTDRPRSSAPAYSRTDLLLGGGSLINLLTIGILLRLLVSRAKSL